MLGAIRSITCAAVFGAVLSLGPPAINTERTVSSLSRRPEQLSSSRGSHRSTNVRKDWGSRQSGGGARGPAGPGGSWGPVPGIGTVGDSWFLQYVSPFQRFYNSRDKRHRFHAEFQPISTFLSNGYYQEPTPGGIVTVTRYNQLTGEIESLCPHIIPLFAALNSRGNSEKLTTSQTELYSLVAAGWYRIPQVGYCVRGPYCGAIRTLWELRDTTRSGDIIYTTDMNEYRVLNFNPGPYRGSAKGPICYLW